MRALGHSKPVFQRPSLRAGMCGRCLGVFMLGKAADMSIYRSKRGPMADKVTWRD